MKVSLVTVVFLFSFIGLFGNQLITEAFNVNQVWYGMIWAIATALSLCYTVGLSYRSTPRSKLGR